DYWAGCLFAGLAASGGMAETLNIPEQNGRVLTARGQRLAIRGKGDAKDRPLLPIHVSNYLAGGHFHQESLVIVISRGRQLAVGRKGHVPDGVLVWTGADRGTRRQVDQVGLKRPMAAAHHHRLAIRGQGQGERIEGQLIRLVGNELARARLPEKNPVL